MEQWIEESGIMNKNIRKRSMVEYPYAITKRIFHFSHVMVTTIRRVRVKFMFACIENHKWIA